MSPLKEISENKIKPNIQSCPQCSEKFESEDLLQNHLRVHEQECRECKKSFSTKSNLRRHRVNVHGEEAMEDEIIVKTPVKGEDSESKENLSEVTATCDVCNQGFRGRCGKSNMERHKANLHPENVGKDDNSGDETDEEDQDDDCVQPVTDLDIATDFYNRILLGINW